MAQWLKEKRKKKSLSPVKQKASVVSKSTLIFNLAIPRLEEACGKEKKMRGVIFLTSPCGLALKF